MSLEQSVANREVTRIVHATPFVNLIHIATNGQIRSTKHLSEDARGFYDPSDLLRADKHEHLVSSSIEMPNAYYVNKKQKLPSTEQKFAPEWVYLEIDPKWLFDPTTRFCPHNAAGFSGAGIGVGKSAFEGMYAQTVVAPQRPWNRSSNHLKPCPTDVQAEVLIPDGVPFSDVRAIISPNEDEARWVHSALVQANAKLARIELRGSPVLFDGPALGRMIRLGNRPPEEVFEVSKA